VLVRLRAFFVHQHQVVKVHHQNQVVSLKVGVLNLQKAKINLDYAKNQGLWDLSLVAGMSRTRGGGGLVSSDPTQLPTSTNAPDPIGI